MDFRLCISQQTEEVQGWYLLGARSVGHDTLQRYLLRFNGLRDAQGRFTNLHDALLWCEHTDRVTPQELRSILESIDTADANQEFSQLIRRYDAQNDPFAEQGAIQSVRELKKRIIAIESNIDLSAFPEHVLEITTAPGFDVSALDRMQRYRTREFDALVSGQLDQEQPFQPHRRVFVSRPLTDAVKEALGSHRQGIRGTAHDVKGLFHELKQLIKGRQIGDKPMEVVDLFDRIPVELEQDIIRMLQDQRVNVGVVVEAELLPKSDPQGWVSGNYTDCCMPFGDSKNDDYMFNRGTQYFIVKYNGRIIAQSVVVDSRDKKDSSDVVVLDNIEVANNYRQHSALIDRAYRVFWSEYTSKPVKIGTGYSDLVPMGASLEPNRYEPKNYLSYSDARGSQIYNLPKMVEITSLDEVVTFANVSEGDARLMADIEKRSYPGDMVQGIDQIKEVLRQAREMELPGAAGSFLVRQGNEPVGYVLLLPEESEVNKGEIAIHVYDMVILPEYRGKGIATNMMERVFESATAYAGQIEGFYGTIEAEARASTSYAMISNERVRRWIERNGFKLTHNHKMDKYLGEEDFYFVRFERIHEQEAETVAE